MKRASLVFLLSLFISFGALAKGKRTCSDTIKSTDHQTDEFENEQSNEYSDDQAEEKGETQPLFEGPASEDPATTKSDIQIFYESSPHWKEIKGLVSQFGKIVDQLQEIPEDNQRIILELSKIYNTTPQAIEQGLLRAFGTNRRAKNNKAKLPDAVDEFIELAKEIGPAALHRVADRRIFSRARTEALRKAVRDSSELIFFKLVENQDVKAFEAVLALSKNLSAPIIVAPAFADVGRIPLTMRWLFDQPNVHIFIDMELEIAPDLVVTNNGVMDKNKSPLTGLEQIFPPTTRVVVFHPRVRTITRATELYDRQTGWLQTTGSMSLPAYRDRFDQGKSTDYNAQKEAEKNLGVLVLSRRYEDKNFSSIVQPANAVAPRRALWTESFYGNPAGIFDLGKIYSGKIDGRRGAKDYVTVPEIPMIVPGDIHLGNTDPQAIGSLLDFLVSMDILKKNPLFGSGLSNGFQMAFIPGKVKLLGMALHDLVEGSPFNGHTFDQIISRARMDQKGDLDIKNHFMNAAGFLKQMRAVLPDTEIFIPLDNHGAEWLVKKLQVGDFVKGNAPKEIPFLYELAQYLTDAEGPSAKHVYERIFQYFGVDTSHVHFVYPGEDVRVGVELKSSRAGINGVSVGKHSQEGINGAKSISNPKLLAALGAFLAGHTHSTSEVGQGKRVGTNTKTRQAFHRGPSNSDQSLAIIYSDTAVQLLRLENGTYVPNSSEQQAEHFFPSPDYPKIREWSIPSGGGTQTSSLRSRPPRERTANHR